MRSLEVKPTEANLIGAINEDLIKRNEDLVRFYRILCAQENSCSIAIDGKWGSGKTFFVKQEQLLVNAMNPRSEINDETKDSIIKKLGLEAEFNDPEHNAVAVYYDAWEHDNDSDPISSIVYDIINQLNMKYDLSENTGLVDLAFSVIDAFSGRSISDVKNKFKSNNLIALLKNEREVEDKFKEFFTDVLKERGNRLVVFIDELDRCKPSYAVQLLERIKHYMEDDRITYVFSVNKEQLQHTIKHYYGNDFDASRYLERFFDLPIELPPADYTALFSRIGLDGNYRVDIVCRRVINFFNFQLREMYRYYETVRAAIYAPTHDGVEYDFSFYDGKVRRVLLTYVVPVVIGLRIADIDEYQRFIRGEAPEVLINIFDNTESGFGLIEELRGRSALSLEEDDTDSVTDAELLREMYNAIYVEPYEGGTFSKDVGQCIFNAGSKDFVNKVASMLSQYADYSL